MKKYLLGFAALSLLFVATSCNNETVETSGSGKNQIKIQPYLGKPTKATETTIANLQTTAVSDATGIPVAVYRETPDPSFDDVWSLYYDALATPPAWTYGTAVPHPSGSVAYYAWYPETNAPALEASSAYAGASLAYTIQPAATQEDLIAANITTTLPTVGLEFNHILSQVNFAIQGVQDVMVRLENIKVNTVLNSGTYTFGGSWVQDASTDSYDYTPYDVNGNSTIDPAEYTTTGANTDIFYLGNEGGSGNNAKDNALMLMPQTFTGSENFSFTFTLLDAADGTTVQATGSVSVDLDELTAGWDMGKRYLYVIDFTDYLVGRDIVFTVRVNGWTDADATNIAQPVIVADATKLSIEAAITTQNTAKTAALTVFPIWVSEDTSAAIELADFTEANFVTGDVIRINFPAGSTEFVTDLTLNKADWALTTSGTTAILECTRP